MATKWYDVGNGEKRATYYDKPSDTVVAFWKGKEWRVVDGKEEIDAGVADTEEQARLDAEGSLWCYGEQL
jgi:hypothetical protein